jgi:hypothetical protein
MPSHWFLGNLHDYSKPGVLELKKKAQWTSNHNRHYKLNTCVIWISPFSFGMRKPSSCYTIIIIDEEVRKILLVYSIRPLWGEWRTACRCSFCERAPRAKSIERDYKSMKCRIWGLRSPKVLWRKWHHTNHRTKQHISS